MTGTVTEPSADPWLAEDHGRHGVRCASCERIPSVSIMNRTFLYSTLLIAVACAPEEREVPQREITFTAAVEPIATVTSIGLDTLSDSARIHALAPEPDGSSIAFLFADPAKGVSRGLGVVQIGGASATPQLAWPDSVSRVWWSGPHQLSFTAGTGQGVRVIVDAHAPALEAMLSSGSGTDAPPARADANLQIDARRRIQQFIDSVRVQPEGSPQASALRYEADTVLLAPTDSIAAVHVSAGRGVRGVMNPMWYLMHLPGGGVQAIDSLVGESTGLSADAGVWGPDGRFYYARERSIRRAIPRIQ